MTLYNYKAKDRFGSDVAGSMEAASEKAVGTRLNEMGFSPLFVSEKEPTIMDNINQFFMRFQSIKQEEMIVFVRQLASIIGAGVPLLESLEAVYEQVQSAKFKTIILAIRKDIEAGLSFSEALSVHKEVFKPMFVSMVRSGEKAGILADVLDRLANLLEKDYENVQKIKSATRYPIVVLSALMVAFVVVITFVIPKFSVLYENFKTELPLPTRILLGTNYAIMNYWYLMLGALAFLAYAIRKFLSTEYGREMFDRAVLHIPVFGQLLDKLILARFTRMLSAMLNSGIPIIEALNISKDTIDNRILSKVVENVRDEVVKGSGLAAPLRGAKSFPPLVVQMVSIGEKSGSLESMLSKVADYFDRDADYTIKNLTPLLEPLLILVLAFMVVLLAMGVFLPMWDMVKFVRTT